MDIMALGKGSKKKRQIIHLWWISVLPPPPLSAWTEVNNIHTKDFFIHILKNIYITQFFNVFLFDYG